MNSEQTRGNWINQFEARLIEFSVETLKYIDCLPKNQSTLALGNQLARSVTSTALNYGEACVAQSQKDFIHKMSICHKEMNESRVCLNILKKRYPSKPISDSFLKEATELCKILGTSINTAKKNSRSSQN